ncbi:hypothetical protein V6N13_038097 [Hibiscus sabdariffa]
MFENLSAENSKFGSNLPKAIWRIEILNAVDGNGGNKQADNAEFKGEKSIWGYHSFLALSELEDPERGYLLNDACLVEAYISTDRTDGLISHEFILETDSDKQKTKEADRVTVKATIDNQKTEPVEITTPPPTQPSCPTVATESELSTEEDMQTFFSSLESELSSSKTVFSREEAKEALAKVEEALTMTPAIFYGSGNFSSLKQAFKILASFDCSSSALTIKQKNKLLAMEESIKELAGRADKAKQDKNHLTEKESIKLTLTGTLDGNVIRYKEVESEVKQIEQKLAALHKQVEEAEKKRENMLGEREGIFKSSKEMKVELDALGKEWSEYEANAKVAEEVEKTVEAEWGRMKCHPWIQIHGVAPNKPLDYAVLSRMKQFSVMNKLKKMALGVIAESLCLSQEEIAGLKEMFKMIDTDNSGQIDHLRRS